MNTRLTVLLGKEFDSGLIRGMVRNGKSVLWHREGPLPRGLRQSYEGVDWVYCCMAANQWEPQIQERIGGEQDRCIILALPGAEAVSAEGAVKTGALPWPPSLRQLLNVLKRPVSEPNHQFQRYCRDSFAEWETVRQAKETLIHRHGCTEPEAYAALRRMSMDRCTTIREVARQVMTGC